MAINYKRHSQSYSSKGEYNIQCRLFSVKLTRLQIMKKMETNLNDVVISVSMQGSRRVLRSNEINLPPSGLIDTDLDLSFSLQYPHFLKRSRNNVQIMIQRRKRYKTRAILGFKTLAVGLVNLSEILQYPVSAKRPLHMHMKGDSTILATVTMTNLISQPVENDLDRELPERNSDDRALEDNSSDEEDESYSSDGSDSAGEMEPVQDILGPSTKGRKAKFRPNQIKFKKKFIALLKKFRVPEEEVFGEGSPREAEGGDSMADDVIYPEDLEIFDSDADSDVELGDNASIKSQDKPKLRPYFDRAASVDSMYVEKKSKSGQGVKKMTRFDSEESTEAEHPTQEVSSPHSDSERHSDSPAAHSDTPLAHNQLRKLKDNSSKTRRSLSVKEVKNKNKAKLERRKSDLEIQDVPKITVSEQLSSCFPPDDDRLPPSILMVSTSEWQGQLLALKLKEKQSRIICTNCDSEVQDVIAAILIKYQKYCHNHSISPPCLKIAIAGTEGYIGVVLRPFVEQFSSKPMWQSYIRFLVIPLDSNHSVGKYISHVDSAYSSLFMDSIWRDIFEKPDSNADFETVNQRINTYVKGANVTHHLPIAEALVNRHGFDEDSSRFIPFVGMVRIGCAELGETEDIVNGNTTSPSTLQISNHKDSSQNMNISSASPPNESKLGSTTNKESNPQSSTSCNEVMDLQVDYWTAGGKKEGSKTTLKTAFKSLVVSRHHNIEEPGTLQMIATTKEQNIRKVHAKSAFEAMMRGKKSKERDSDAKGPIVANVTKLVCTSKSQSDSLNVVIDGVSWDGVKFFSLSPQWSRHVKTFPIGLIGPVETCF
ncbi:phosphofurin acidic cluster sorting protein 1-like isoform X2 [Dendronephthya gigantea]|uniref:phosphofurin acidic cluster sorting protein 1-like isoform X2 n=1 Tax=Dendronephthya gigantea TaxID=151771 RepID=UPI00106A6422|nr:phosphofurin acidic cluster sorting protein 1-like isoform X2 [Dendronephthya gigantea]